MTELTTTVYTKTADDQDFAESFTCPVDELAVPSIDTVRAYFPETPNDAAIAETTDEFTHGCSRTFRAEWAEAQADGYPYAVRVVQFDSHLVETVTLSADELAEIEVEVFAELGIETDDAGRIVDIIVTVESIHDTTSPDCRWSEKFTGRDEADAYFAEHVAMLPASHRVEMRDVRCTPSLVLDRYDPPAEVTVPHLVSRVMACVDQEARQRSAPGVWARHGATWFERLRDLVGMEEATHLVNAEHDRRADEATAERDRQLDAISAEFAAYGVAAYPVA